MYQNHPFVQRWLVVFIVVATALSAVTAQETTKPSTLEQRLAVVEKSLDALRTWVSSLSSRSPSSWVFLDCDTGKYVEVAPKTSNLVFLAACERVEPYMEGHRVTVAIGNPHYVNFRDLKGSLGYGDEPLKTLEQKAELSTVAEVKAGSWNRVTVTVNPSTPKDLRHVALEFSVDTASLSR